MDAHARLKNEFTGGRTVPYLMRRLISHRTAYAELQKCVEMTNRITHNNQPTHYAANGIVRWNRLVLERTMSSLFVSFLKDVKIVFVMLTFYRGITCLTANN